MGRTAVTGDKICPLCSGSEPKALLHDWKTYQWWDCPECGIAYVIPFKNPGAEFYADFADLYPHEAQEETDPMDPEFDECLDSLGAGAGRRLLDIGCGGGGFLSRAKKQGFEVSGIDFNEVRLKLVREKLGVESLYHGSLPDFFAKHPDERFDVITLFQVIEHLDQPAQWLRAARQLLKPGGRFFIGTPNRDRTFNPFQGPGMEEVDNPPNHLTRWRADSMKRFVESCGFRALEVKSLGVPLPLLALLLRNTLRFGLATRALNVDQLQHAAPQAQAKGPVSLKTRLVQAAVKLKELLINSAALLLYPFFRLAFALFGWQGVVLYCVAEPM
jgi:SAM-dependent methyltransferase